MSSAGGDGGSSGSGSGEGGVTSGEPRQYFCHQCDRTVSISPSSSDLLCPNCNEGFLEELEIPLTNPNPNPVNPFFSFNSDSPATGAATFPLLFSGAGTPGAASPPPLGDANAFNPFMFLQNYVQTLRAGGANVQFVIENSGDPNRTFQFPGNVNHGDYFFGPGLEELIQQLAENDPNRRGTPPASKSAVEGLPDIPVTEELLASDSASAQCAVCKDTFGLGENAKQMPCKHIYHADCILPWLEMHNSCPVCRYELPTDDNDYEQRASRGGAPNDNSRWMRFRVPLTGQFNQFGSSVAGTSNVGNADNNNNNSSSNNNNDGNNSGQSNLESRGNQNLESETRQEDLD
ncbi:E3 ubiquitin-protein ligase RING1-like isoform X2 [Gastrolobium bilobum]|uniref:E3 ubiquitin-protein ligase RING1-like isoform X2 n=1 Tax=Gastrolobium bilobum TaxID=150636 RepID=UPI002AB08EA1|nr:E3 ubiquitin-protein ligase RING1-like isoform X2 [Gastrolobium bilobum]